MGSLTRDRVSHGTVGAPALTETTMRMRWKRWRGMAAIMSSSSWCHGKQAKAEPLVGSLVIHWPSWCPPHCPLLFSVKISVPSLSLSPHHRTFTFSTVNHSLVFCWLLSSCLSDLFGESNAPESHATRKTKESALHTSPSEFTSPPDPTSIPPFPSTLVQSGPVRPWAAQVELQLKKKGMRNQKGAPCCLNKFLGGIPRGRPTTLALALVARTRRLQRGSKTPSGCSSPRNRPRWR
ncbi:hypothetical protein HDK77DRAFT_218132 [Phyllosticta capitalensis]